MGLFLQGAFFDELAKDGEITLADLDVYLAKLGSP